MNKKGQIFGELGSLAVGVAVLAITLTVTFLILAQGKAQIEVLEGVASNTSAYNATVTLTNAVATIPAWIPLVIIAVIGSVLLGLVALFRRR